MANNTFGRQPYHMGHIIFTLDFLALNIFSDGVPAFEIERNSKLFESEDAKDICS